MINFNIASINWPTDGREANILLRKLFLKLLCAADIDFSNLRPDPRTVVGDYLNGSLVDGECRVHGIVYRSYLNGEAIRDFRSPHAINIRLAISLVHINEEKSDDLGDQLSWFIELLGYKGENEELIVDAVTEYFKIYI